MESENERIQKVIVRSEKRAKAMSKQLILKLVMASLIVLSFGYTTIEARAGAYDQLVTIAGGDDINIPIPTPVCEGIPNPQYPDDPSKLLPCDYYEKNGNEVITPNENDVPVRQNNYNEPPPLPVMQIENSNFIDSTIKGFFDIFTSWFKPQQLTTTPKATPKTTSRPMPITTQKAIPKTTLSEQELSEIDQKSKEHFDKCFYALDSSNGEKPEVACRETLKYYSDNRAALNQISNSDDYAEGIIEILKQYGDATPVATPKATKLPDITSIFNEANRLHDLCSAEINISNNMNTQIFGRGAVSDKALIMKMVNQYEYQDSICLKAAKYMKNNIKVLDAGIPKGWASNTINIYIDNHNSHTEWYNYLNEDGDFSISPSKFEV